MVDLIRQAPDRVLDLGCGGGLTGALVRREYPGAVLCGVEGDPALAAQASQHMDRVLCASIEDPATWRQLGEQAPFDVVILADVLEHLSDPWHVTRQCVGLLSQQGCVITSIPNVRHISTFVALGVKGTWPRRARGIHDATHLRFFCRRDILDLGARSGLRMVEERRNLRLFESRAWSALPAALLDFWPIRPFLTFQYLHVWRRVEP